MSSASCRSETHGWGTQPCPARAHLWVQTIEDELPTDPYTVSRRSLRETAQSLHRALLNEIERSKRQIAEVEGA